MLETGLFAWPATNFTNEASKRWFAYGLEKVAVISLRRWYLRGFTLYLHPVLYNLSAFLAILSSSLSTYDLHTYEKIFSFQIAIEQILYPGENLFSTKNSFF